MASVGSNSSSDAPLDDGLNSDNGEWINPNASVALCEDSETNRSDANLERGAPALKPNFPDAKTLYSGTKSMNEV